jgi:hypothetical protein
MKTPSTSSDRTQQLHRAEPLKHDPPMPMPPVTARMQELRCAAQDLVEISRAASARVSNSMVAFDHPPSDVKDECISSLIDETRDLLLTTRAQLDSLLSQL